VAVVAAQVLLVQMLETLVVRVEQVQVIQFLGHP
jgi:hypothetical protein